MKYDDIIEVMQTLVSDWGEDGKKVIEVCFKQETKAMTCDEFLDNCTACGGNWGGMLLTGIKRLYPEVWDAIPDQMGCSAWVDIISVLKLLKITF